MAEQVYVVHYAELALKGKNRGYFESLLANNIRQKLGQDYKVERLQGRIIIRPPRGSEEETKERLREVIGIKNYAPAYLVDNDVLFKEVPEIVNLGSVPSFRVTARRTDKRFPMNSMEIQAKLGEAFIERYPKVKVQLSNPSLTVNVEVLEDRSLVYWLKYEGIGGLPVGSSGKVLSLFSGGIDSPVASFLAMKRGCRTDLIHFHAFPNASQVKGTKIEELARRLSRFEPSIKVLLAPYHYFYVYFLNYPEKYHLVLFRRFMMRVASRVLESEGYDALVTGDSLSQVASQVMNNLKLIDKATDSLVLRPLITYDKEEIIEKAREIGTYELSIKPYRDCCSMVSLHPSL
ncbi:MAG: tRNA uracil 4-sulfurtransferase ThiI, partial [TACK group archaeon]|nr:tRNA uracil 4-sulfurtransferase ThiI [TACK group archaeon]